jgi:hypothetical protein
LITKETVNNFIDLPSYILDKVDSGLISLTLLSDIIRAKLLSKRGGLWLDSTILVVKPLPEFNGLAYWTPKWLIDTKDSKKYRLWYGLWKISQVPKLTITQCIGIWYSLPQNPIFTCLEDFWLSYWKQENTDPYYWTTEVFLIGNMYQSIPNVRSQIDNLDFNNSKCFDLPEVINKKYSETNFNHLQRDTQFFYLSRKAEYHERLHDSGELTYYGYFKQKYS